MSTKHLMGPYRCSLGQHWSASFMQEVFLVDVDMLMQTGDTTSAENKLLSAQNTRLAFE